MPYLNSMYVRQHLPYGPPTSTSLGGTIHVVVVDPGVGTSRRALVIRSRNYYFVGPDNGVLMMLPVMMVSLR